MSISKVQHQNLENMCLERYGGFLKWWVSPTISMGFPTKNDHFGVFWGYHHVRKHPYIKTSNQILKWSNPLLKMMGSHVVRKTTFFFAVFIFSEVRSFWKKNFYGFFSLYANIVNYGNVKSNFRLTILRSRKGMDKIFTTKKGKFITNENQMGVSLNGGTPKPP